MERLNRTSAPQAKRYTEKVIQFGEGNFLRAFIDWIIWKTNQKTDFNGSVVVVQPIEKGMVEWLNEQDGLYHLNLQGLLGGQTVNSLDLIDVVSRGLNPYQDGMGVQQDGANAKKLIFQGFDCSFVMNVMSFISV